MIMRFKKILTVFLIVSVSLYAPLSYSAIFVPVVKASIAIATIFGYFNSPYGKKILKKIGNELFDADDVEVNNDSVIFISSDDGKGSCVLGAFTGTPSFVSERYSQVAHYPNFVVRNKSLKQLPVPRNLVDSVVAYYEYSLDLYDKDDEEKYLGRSISEIPCYKGEKEHKISFKQIIDELEKRSKDGDDDARSLLLSILSDDSDDDDDTRKKKKKSRCEINPHLPDCDKDDDTRKKKKCEENPNLAECRDDDDSDFCTTYVIICDFLKLDHEFENDKPLEPQRIDLKGPDTFDKNYIDAVDVCPDDVVRMIPVGNNSFKLVFEMSPICDFASTYLKPVIIFMAYVYGALMICSALRVD